MRANLKGLMSWAGVTLWMGWRRVKMPRTVQTVWMVWNAKRKIHLAQQSVIACPPRRSAHRQEGEEALPPDWLARSR